MKKIFVIFLIFQLLLLTSCWDAMELENRGFVITLGVDKYSGGSEENEADRFSISISLPNAANIVNNGSGSLKTVKTSSSQTISEGMRIIDSYFSKKLYFGHTKAIILGEGLLSDPGLFSEAVDALERNRELNRKIMVLAADGKAESILKLESAGEPLVGMYISNFYKNRSSTINVATTQTLEGLIQDLRATGNTVLPVISAVSPEDGSDSVDNTENGNENNDEAENSGKNNENEDEVENKNKKNEPKIGGVCVIKNFQLAGKLDGSMANGFLWIHGQANGAQLAAQYENSFVPFRVIRSSHNISFKENASKDGLICLLKISASGSIGEYKLLGEPLSENGKLGELKKLYENVISNEVFSAMGYLQSEIKTDALAFSEVLRKHNYGLYKIYGGDNWEKYFSEMQVELSVNVKIVNTGALK